ncbi:[FeFe] hydrogenase [Parelusimicrobium proximum]|uniref:4Fe-4S dicluster domain-containing protein n=1 Tax=Parelusimicrobium proximum TaxID=3228953 RepID=UPI003D1826AF
MNTSDYFRREVLLELSKMAFEDRLEKDIHRIPYNIIPMDSADRYRCCEYKERAILKYRVWAALGYSVNEVDDAEHLNAYAKKENLDNKEGKLLTVLESACKACIKTPYFVTDVCQGCLARSCINACSFDSVKMENGRAKIDADKCKACGKCKTACPYGAILKLSVPCEEACPVSAIKKDELGRAKIEHASCISCGKCMKACPFGAVMERSQILDVIELVKSDNPAVAMVAPAIAGQFGVSMGKLYTALKQLGFREVYEVAKGAETTAENEAKEFNERINERGEKFMTSSCCYAYIRLVEKHMPELAPYVSHTRTPMHYTARLVQRDMPQATTVFVGPCLSKRKEGLQDEFVDYVINFHELEAMLAAKNINVKECEESSLPARPSAASRRFPTVGGVTKAVQEAAKSDAGIKAELINGLDSKTVAKLRAYCKVGCGDKNFLEIMACEGGCIGGPDALQDKLTAAREIEKDILS